MWLLYENKVKNTSNEMSYRGGLRRAPEACHAFKHMNSRGEILKHFNQIKTQRKHIELND